MHICNLNMHCSQGIVCQLYSDSRRLGRHISSRDTMTKWQRVEMIVLCRMLKKRMISLLVRFALRNLQNQSICHVFIHFAKRAFNRI